MDVAAVIAAVEAALHRLHTETLPAYAGLPDHVRDNVLDQIVADGVIAALEAQSEFHVPFMLRSPLGGAHR